MESEVEVEVLNEQVAQKLSNDHFKIHLKYVKKHEEVKEMEKKLNEMQSTINSYTEQYIGWLDILASEYNLEDGDAIDGEGNILKNYKQTSEKNKV